MNLSTTLSHQGVRQAIVAQVAMIAIAGIGAAWASRVWPEQSSGLLPVTVWVAAVACGGGLLVVWRLTHLLTWDRTLAALDAESLDPLTLASASGATAADRGWNRLVEQGRRWQSLTELEQALTDQLAQDVVGDAGRLLDAISNGVAAVDSAGVITYANNVMAGICGSDAPRDLIGKALSQALRADPATAHRLAESSNHQSDVEWSVPSASGSRTLRGERRVLPGGDSECPISVWTFRDVTQQRLAEAMRERFLTTATHEFRTPLANIRAYAESLDLGHDIDAEERKRFYNVIQSESLRLSQLVDDLLDISRMQAGAVTLDSYETDLERLVQEAVTKVQGQMQDKNLQFRCDLPPKFPKIIADKSKLTAVLVNLLGNAAKYTPEGGKVTFRVDVTVDKVQFSVTDTGIGIAPEELPKVFERFYRSGDDRVQNIPGSGLGLAVTEEIVRLHGGEVSAESTLDKGSTFRFFIPLDSPL